MRHNTRDSAIITDCCFLCSVVLHSLCLHHPKIASI
jgi:hypothetical protein